MYNTNVRTIKNKQDNMENFGFIGIVNADCMKWEYFEMEPKHLRDIYELTEDGFSVFHSWNEEGGYEDYDDMEILEMIIRDDTLSNKLGYFVYKNDLH